MNAPATPPPSSPEHFQRALGLLPAVAVNMTQMCGIGPFVTIPLMVAALGGPQAMLGWLLGAFLVMADGLVWAELGAAMPGAGGTYLYLREAFQYSTGRLMPFLFIWTAMLTIPLTMATGVIGLVQYLGYYWPGMTYGTTHVIGLLVMVLVLLALYRDTSAVGALTTALWLVMLFTVGAVIVACLTHFDPHLATALPSWAFSLHGGPMGVIPGSNPPATGVQPSFFTGLGAGLIIAIYDYNGYNTSAYMGAELRQPGRTLPRSIIYSILGMMILYLLLQAGVLGVLPWRDVAASTSIGSAVLEKTWGKFAAQIFTGLIVVTAFASIFTGLLGGSRVPFNAARDRMFLPVFGRLHPTRNFPHVAVIVLCAITLVGSLFPLDQVIAMLTAVMVLVQCLAQIAALVVLRRRQPGLRRPYKMWAYPLPALVAATGWLYVFSATADQHLDLGPVRINLVLVALAWLALGLGAFLLWARAEKSWPFGPREIREEFLTAPPPPD